MLYWLFNKKRKTRVTCLCKVADEHTVRKPSLADVLAVLIRRRRFLSCPPHRYPSTLIGLFDLPAFVGNTKSPIWPKGNCISISYSFSAALHLLAGLSALMQCEIVSRTIGLAFTSNEQGGESEGHATTVIPVNSLCCGRNERKATLRAATQPQSEIFFSPSCEGGVRKYLILWKYKPFNRLQRIMTPCTSILTPSVPNGNNAAG